MALLGATFTLTSKEQFLAELDDLTRVDRSASLEQIDYALRSFVAFASHFYEDFLLDPWTCQHTIYRLLQSDFWQLHSERHCHTLIGLILTNEQRPATVSFCLEVLALFGREYHFAHRLMRRTHPSAADSPDTFAHSTVTQLMISLIETHVPGSGESQDLISARLPWLCAETLYETSRHTKMTPHDLSQFSDAFIVRLFELVELTRDYRDDTFNYTLIKLIIALNEQFMVASLHHKKSASKSQKKSHQRSPSNGAEEEAEPNAVLRTIRDYMGSHKTFGENLIFILNRCAESEEDRCVSLLILKILYLLFTSPGTNEYFYTNDLCVLVDIFIRELHDLSEDAQGPRHTFLRVLHPLLVNTQLRIIPYKREELRRQLKEMITESSRTQVDPTTRRLVERNLKAPWCSEMEAMDIIQGPDQKPSPKVAISSPEAIEPSLPTASSSSTETNYQLEEAETALTEMKISKPGLRQPSVTDEDDLSRRGSTISTNSVGSARSVAAAAAAAGPATATSPDRLSADFTDAFSPMTPAIPRPSSANSATSPFKKRKPPPIPGSKRHDQQQTSNRQVSHSSLVHNASDSALDNPSFRRRVQSDAAPPPMLHKRAPPPIPVSKKKNTSDTHSSS